MSSGRPLVLVSTAPANRGPAHYLLSLATGQQPLRRVVLVTSPGYLLDQARALGFETRALPEGDLGRAKTLIDAVGSVERAVVLANNVGDAIRSIPATRRHGTPLFCVLHASRWTRRDVVRARLLQSLAPEVSLLAVSPFVQGIAHGAGLAKHQAVRPLPNAVPDDLFALGEARLQRPPTDSDAPRLLYIGSKSPRKGFHTLIGTLERMPEHLRARIEIDLAGVFDLASAGRFVPSMSERARAQDDGRLHKLGRVENIRACLERADAVFLPSPMESFGRPVIEAFAAGVPVVCSDNPGHLGLVAHGSTASVFPVGDERRACEALVDVFEDRAAARERASTAFQVARAFSASRVAAALAALIDG